MYLLNSLGILEVFYNVEEILYDVFNPQYHQAIQNVDSDNHETGNIVNIMQKGYYINDKLLRPAIVTIAT